MTRKVHAWRVGFAITALASLASVLSDSRSAASAEVNVLSASGMREVMTDLHPVLERAVGQRVTMSFAEAGDLRRRIREGEIGDVIVLPRVVLDQVVADGSVVPGTTVDLGQSAMGIGIRAGAPRPDITSGDGLKRALLAATSIAITDPASGGVTGVHLAEVFRRLGIAEELKPKLLLNRGARNAQLVARGEAEMAIQLAHEIRPIRGIEFIPLPAEFQRTFVFSAGLGSKARDLNASKAVLQFLSGPEATAVVQAKGMDLPPTK